MLFLNRTVLMVFMVLIQLLYISQNCVGQESFIQQSDTLGKQEHLEKTKKKASLGPRFSLTINGVFASLDTYARFETPNNLLGVKLSLEDNLGLVNSKYFFHSTFIYRITPRSGIYASYYGLNRSNSYTLKEDIPYLDKIIPKRTEIDAYFNTRVASAGYLYSILTEPNSFLGAYCNIFFITLKTGVVSDVNNLKEEVSYLAPLPNFGLVTYFKLHKWMGIGANASVFFINLDDFNGNIYDVGLMLNLKATKWLAFNLGYTSFNIHVYFEEKDYNTTVGYNFRGPTLGAEFKF